MSETILISEIIAEFTQGVGKSENDIKRLLLQPTVSTSHMTRIMQEEPYRASKAVITDLTQGFQKGWTPKGNATFTPITIPHRRHKIDLEFWPDEIVGTWLGFLATENTNRTAWPITRFIREKLIADKVAQNRELKSYGTGVFEEVVTGEAQEVGKSMDGFCTILEARKASGTSNINFIDLDPLTSTNIFDQVEAFADAISEIYQAIPMNVYLSNSWFRKYLRRRRDLHGLDNNYDGMKNYQVEGSHLTLVPLPSMAGKDILFCTPRENFIWLTKINDGASALNVETSKREIFLFADWHESIGFGIEEAIFAYVPDGASASE